MALSPTTPIMKVIKFRQDVAYGLPVLRRASSMPIWATTSTSVIVRMSDLEADGKADPRAARHPRLSGDGVGAGYPPRQRRADRQLGMPLWADWARSAVWPITGRRKSRHRSRCAPPPGASAAWLVQTHRARRSGRCAAVDPHFGDAVPAASATPATASTASEWFGGHRFGNSECLGHRQPRPRGVRLEGLQPSTWTSNRRGNVRHLTADAGAPGGGRQPHEGPGLQADRRRPTTLGVNGRPGVISPLYGSRGATAIACLLRQAWVLRDLKADPVTAANRDARNRARVTLTKNNLLSLYRRCAGLDGVIRHEILEITQRLLKRKKPAQVHRCRAGVPSAARRWTAVLGQMPRLTVSPEDGDTTLSPVGGGIEAQYKAGARSPASLAAGASAIGRLAGWGGRDWVRRGVGRSRGSGFFPHSPFVILSSAWRRGTSEAGGGAG